MKQRYWVFKKYLGNFDGYLWIPGEKKYHEWTFQKEYATTFTLKQASKICFDKNNESRKNFSYYYFYGWQPVE